MSSFLIWDIRSSVPSFMIDIVTEGWTGSESLYLIIKINQISHHNISSRSFFLIPTEKKHTTKLNVSWKAQVHLRKEKSTTWTGRIWFQKRAITISISIQPSTYTKPDLYSSTMCIVCVGWYFCKDAEDNDAQCRCQKWKVLVDEERVALRCVKINTLGAWVQSKIERNSVPTFFISVAQPMYKGKFWVKMLLLLGSWCDGIMLSAKCLSIEWTTEVWTLTNHTTHEPVWPALSFQPYQIYYIHAKFEATSGWCWVCKGGNYLYRNQ